MPLIVANWPGIITGSEPCCGMVTPTGGDPPDWPCVHTPSNRGTVPQGQVVAEAGAATTSDPATDANAQQAIRIRRFTVTTLARGHRAARAVQVVARLNDALRHAGLGLLHISAGVIGLLVAHLAVDLEHTVVVG